MRIGSSAGWEAAVLDHVQAMVQTIASKLRQDTMAASLGDNVGGSTYTLEIWPGHPLETEALGELSLFRERLSHLRARIAAHNASDTLPAQRNRVIVYAGQCVIPLEDDEE